MPQHPINAAHETILIHAAKIANAHPDKHPQFFFQPAGVASEKTAKGIDGLCLEWDPADDISRYSPETQQWIIYLMQRVGQEAIKQAIIDNGSTFVGLIIAEAKQGRNYFDYWHNTTTLDTLD